MPYFVLLILTIIIIIIIIYMTDKIYLLKAFEYPSKDFVCIFVQKLLLILLLKSSYQT